MIQRLFRCWVFLTVLFMASALRAQFPHFDSIVMLPVDLPARFDLRETGQLSPLRVQAAGGCWSAAAMSSVESFIKSSGGETPVFSDKNLYRFHKYHSLRSTYGNHMMATAYFVRGAGPFVSTPQADTVQPAGHPPVLINNARFIPNNQTLVKKVIYRFGAVSTMLQFRPETLDSLTHIHYAKNENINHVVNLVGWDDTKPTANGVGAWIAQNSLGAKSGENGFFFIPFSDRSVLQYNAVWPEWMDYPDNLDILYYDTLGQTSTYGFNDTVCYALIKFQAPHDGILRAIGTYVAQENSTIETSVYQNYFNEGDGPFQSILGQSAPRVCRFEGYYTVDLAHPVKLNKGEPFYIKIRYSVPADTCRIPVERYIENYSNPLTGKDRCWVNPDESKWPDSWYLCGETSDYNALKFNLCIKAYFYTEER